MPWARSRSHPAWLPTVRRRSSGSAWRTSTRRSRRMLRRRAAVTGPTPHSASTGSRCRNDSTRSGATTVSPSGFFHADAIFARNLLGATPAEAVSPVVSRICCLEAPGDVDGQRLVPRVLGDVEVGLIERERLHQRRDGTEEREHVGRHGPVLREVGRDDGEVGTEADRPGHRHGGPDAEGPRLVAGRRHHAAPLRPAADGDGLASQLGPVALFDGRVERVHVDVDDAAHGKKNTEDRQTEDRSESESCAAVSSAEDVSSAVHASCSTSPQPRL